MANPASNIQIPRTARQTQADESPVSTAVSSAQPPTVVPMETLRQLGMLPPEMEAKELQKQIAVLTSRNEELEEKVTLLEEQIKVRKELDTATREARGKMPIARVKIHAGGVYEKGDVIPESIARQFTEGVEYVRGIVNI